MQSWVHCNLKWFWIWLSAAPAASLQQNFSFWLYLLLDPLLLVIKNMSQKSGNLVIMTNARRARE
jgi:hypothetical protein